jgi:leucyl aminopeptidase
MKNTFFAIALSLPFSMFAFAKPMWVSVDSKVLEKIKPLLSRPHEEVFSGSRGTVLKLDLKEIEELSHSIHHNLRRCGGFSSFESSAEALLSADNKLDAVLGNKIIFTDYAINQQTKTTPIVSEVSEAQVRSTILKLSSFETRLYYSAEGAAATKYIHDTWAAMARNRSDIKVELVKHRGYNQHSVIMTIEGSDLKDEIAVLGGHADSISDTHLAPGADDNASGIASITEVIRLMIKHDIKPRRTIQFMAYAAEEVGLWGSRDISHAYKREQKKVIGVMQLDMTLFKGSSDKDILLTTDWTNKAQNEFLGKLIDEYVKVPWGYTACGYSCSDHASWNDAGFPASYPQESYMADSNTLIHTQDDTLETAGGTADHAAKFSKLAIAFLMEIAH